VRCKVFKLALSLPLVAALMITPLATEALGNSASDLARSDQPAAIHNKNEVIYATLAADGAVEAVYAVNHFEVSQAGGITDYGHYGAVVNLTSTAPLIHDEDSVSFQAETGNFYYQGNMAAAKLPWIFDISYYFDGVKTSPQDLAGKSGNLEIRVSTAQNESIDPVFYNNYLLQVTITLDAEKCTNIEAPDGTMAMAGKNKVVTHTIMPGSDGDIRVTAAVNNFTMGGLEISAVPFSMHLELPETDDLIDDFQKLSDAISDLNDGVGELARGVADLKKGTGRLEKGSAGIKEGLTQLSGGSGEFSRGSAQIKDALEEIAASLESGSAGDFDPGDLAQLPQLLSGLAQGLQEISGGLIELKNNFLTASLALEAAIQGIPGTSITEEEIELLYAHTDSSQHDLLARLIASYTQGLTVKGTYDQVKEAFDAVSSTADTFSGSVAMISGTLETMAENIEEALSSMDLEQIEQLASGLAELAANYADFHAGLTAYLDGVSELAANYTRFDKGITAFHDGIDQLHDGIAELHDGTNELNKETADLPDTIQSEIDALLEKYDAAEFEPVSFTSPRNKHTGFVQFVISSKAIEKEETVEDIPDEAGKATFWDRLRSLFMKDE